jgi:hypothetical protein
MDLTKTLRTQVGFPSASVSNQNPVSHLLSIFDSDIAKPLISDGLSRCRRGWSVPDTLGVS